MAPPARNKLIAIVSPAAKAFVPRVAELHPRYCVVLAKASRSALNRSLCVEGRPCGAPS
jgi:hypothetical protein